MPSFRKKPVVIEAFQLTAETRRDNRDWPEWLNYAWQKNRGEAGALMIAETREDAGSLEIQTLEGVMRCDLGDWIIQGVKGELYPCKPDIFAATYEPVE